MATKSNGPPNGRAVVNQKPSAAECETHFWYPSGKIMPTFDILARPEVSCLSPLDGNIEDSSREHPN
jgi:hypothetical protein